ncbi:hypothetical protein ACL02O_00380 [Micromonospora sp. MS34]|uniref:hypothetical protein n=1 Tax=Micromonospora sp. MS34 TaxID=3385971 RepID=UPI00399F19A0
MTAREFSGVDHDLLADYVGGALDGTPEQDTVARLVEADPAWGEAYAELVRALDLVRADLADWAAGPAPELPPAVADRITAALAGAGPAPAEDAPLDLPGVEGEARPAGATPVVVPAQPTGGSRRAAGTTRPADGPGRRTGPGRRGRRWARIAAPVAVAAASITAVGLGLSNLAGTGVGGSGSSARDEAAPAAGRNGPYRTAVPTASSGTDYTPDRLSGGPVTAFGSPSVAKADPHGPGLAPKGGQRSAPTGLQRLTRPAALDACLTAIDAEHGSGPITVQLVDYASFQGSPALVVTFVDPAGARWAWASGPDCGVPGSGADTRFRTRVG